MADAAGHVFLLFLINRILILFEAAVQLAESLVQTFCSSKWPCDPVLGNNMSSMLWGKCHSPPHHTHKKGEASLPYALHPSTFFLSRLQMRCFSLDFFLPVKNETLDYLNYCTYISVTCSQTQS